MFKTTIMVNKRKKRIYCIISISDKRLSSFLISLISTLSFYYFLLFFPTFFVLILSYLSGTCTFIFADISGRAELSSWTFQSGTYFPGRGGVHVHPVHPPPLRTRQGFIQMPLHHTSYLHSCFRCNHRCVLHKDLPNHSSTQHCSRSIVTRGTLLLWSGRGEDNKNADCCRGWFYLCWLPLFISNILLALDIIGETAIKYGNVFPFFAPFC